MKSKLKPTHKLDYIKLYLDPWREDVRGWTLTQRGAQLELLLSAIRGGGEIVVENHDQIYLDIGAISAKDKADVDWVLSHWDQASVKSRTGKPAIRFTHPLATETVQDWIEFLSGSGRGGATTQERRRSASN